MVGYDHKQPFFVLDLLFFSGIAGGSIFGSVASATGGGTGIGSKETLDRILHHPQLGKSL
jgi:hypothetical protein